MQLSLQLFCGCEEYQMSETPATGNMPSFNVDDVHPERLAQFTSLNFLSPQRIELVKQLSLTLARDPELLASVERMLEANGASLERLTPRPSELASFGWSEDQVDLPSPKQAAAAVGAAVAAVAGGPGAAAVVAV
jgi:hypothetical protein